MSRELEVKNRVGVYVFQKLYAPKKKKYLKKNEKHSLKKLDDVFSFGFTNKIIMSYNTSKFELVINSNSNSIRLNFRR